MTLPFHYDTRENGKEKGSQAKPTLDWKPVESPLEYRLEYATDVKSEILDVRFRNHVLRVKENVGKLLSQPVTPAKLFLALSGFIFADLFKWTETQMRKKHHTPPTMAEFQVFLSMYLAFQVLDIPLDEARNVVHRLTLGFYNGKFFSECVLSVSRYEEILHAIGSHTTVSNWSSFEKTRKLALTKYASVTVQQESAESTQIDNVCVDTLLEIVHSVLSRNDESIDLDALPGGVMICSSGESGGSNLELGLALARHGHSFVLAAMECSEDPFASSSTNQEKLDIYMNTLERRQGKARNHRGPSPKAPVKPAVVVDDQPQLGSEIFACKYEVSNQTTLTAVAIRNSNSMGKRQLLRFVESGTVYADRLCDTFCMEELPLARNVQRDILFFPQKDENKVDHVKITEAILLDSCKALTCYQGTADWLLLRMFIVDETTGQGLALHNVVAKRFLSHAAFKKHLDASEELVDAQEQSLPGEQQEEKDQECCNLQQDEDWDDDNGTDMERVIDFWDDQDAVCSKALTEEEAATTLSKSWVLDQSLSPLDVQSKTQKADESVLHSIRQAPWCKFFYLVGLLQSRERPCLGASPDGIARVRHPSENRDVFCTCVFKTHLSSASTTAALQTASKYASVSELSPFAYFSCSVADTVYWDTVPFSCRGQIIHQAVVTGLSHVLLVVSDNSTCLYASLVKVESDVKAAYTNAVMEWRNCMDWAYQNISPPLGVHHLKAAVPHCFHETDRKVLASHLPLWRALRKKVDGSGPVLPLRAIKSFAQVCCDTLRDGVDFSAQFALAQEDKKPLQMIKQLVANSFSIYKLYKIASTPDLWTTLQQFQTISNKMESFRGFVWDLWQELFKRGSLASVHSQMAVDSHVTTANEEAVVHVTTASEEAVVDSLMTVDSDMTTASEEVDDTQLTREEKADFISKIKIKRGLIRAPKLQEAFNSFTGKRLRLHSPGHTFQPFSSGAKQRQCAGCSGTASHYCTVCLVPLHTTCQKGSRTNCFERWHASEEVDVPSFNIRSKKHRKTASTQSRASKKTRCDTVAFSVDSDEDL